MESRAHGSKRAIHAQLIYGIQSLFQSLNIEVQDVSPDVSGCRKLFKTRITASPQYFKKITVTLLSPLSLWWYRRKNGLKRDQFNTLPVDRKERCATYKCSTVLYV
ncbi:hypothetical protein CA284_04580 [Enterobacter mori]|nr:hypothetical protein CA284_04580 [Enterobacter mori]PWG70427.1 hypothetical protein DEM28_15495 [Enterobacter mori]